MAAPTVTYTFSNTTTADATQVNQNFTDILNALTDGTKDLSISALTLAGNFTANGNTTIGNASSDDLTITASLASSIPLKTHNSYDIGSVTSKGLRAIYFASSSATKTAKLQGPATSSDVTLTLPSTTGTLALTPPAFAANTSTTAASGSTPFIFTSVSGDTHSAYNASTGVYTAPETRAYFVSSIVYTGAGSASLCIYINGAFTAQGTSNVPTSEPAIVSDTFFLTAGDTVEIRPGGASTATGGSQLNRFSVFGI